MTTAAHPGWCSTTEPTSFPAAHLSQVGADIRLSAEHVMFVDLLQVGDRPTTVGVGNHTPDETSVTRLSLVQAAILRDLLSEALGLAEMVGVDRSTVSRSAPGANARRSDLEESPADPLLIVGTVLEVLAARGVPVVVDHSLERAVEAAGRLLRCLGVEALDSRAAAPWTS